MADNDIGTITIPDLGFHDPSERPKLPMFSSSKVSGNDFTGYSDSRKESSVDVGSLIAGIGSGVGSVTTAISKAVRDSRPNSAPIVIEKPIKKATEDNLKDYLPYALLGVFAIAAVSVLTRK